MTGLRSEIDLSPLNMPELEWYFGYPFARGLMLAAAIVMFVYFRRREWL